jgi:hypothetical protein
LAWDYPLNEMMELMLTGGESDYMHAKVRRQGGNGTAVCEERMGDKSMPGNICKALNELEKDFRQLHGK